MARYMFPTRQAGGCSIALEENRHCIDCLEQAATKNAAARYPLEVEGDKSGRNGDPLRNFLTAACLLRLSANASAEQGDAPQAGKALLAIFGLARSLEREPLTLAFSVRHSIESSGCDAIAHCIPKIQLSTEDLADFEMALGHADEQGNQCGVIRQSPECHCVVAGGLSGSVGTGCRRPCRHTGATA